MMPSSGWPKLTKLMCGIPNAHDTPRRLDLYSGGMEQSIDARLRELAIALPPAPTPLANYLPFALSGDLLFLAGQGPRGTDGKWMCGRVGDGVSVEEAYQHARLAG